MIRFLIHTLELQLWLFEVKPCICNVSRPLYVSVRYLENASFWTICRVWSWLFYVVSGRFFLLSVARHLKKKKHTYTQCVAQSPASINAQLYKVLNDAMDNYP